MCSANYDIFKYDRKRSHMENFHSWFLMNTEERKQWNEVPYSQDEGLVVFNKMYGQENTERS